MLDFQRPQLSQKDDYERVLFSCPPRGCEYSFANLYLWGRQQLVFTHGCVAFFSHFNSLFSKEVTAAPLIDEFA